jgi:hypothetical protein
MLMNSWSNFNVVNQSSFWLVIHTASGSECQARTDLKNYRNHFM